ncbi:MAG: hypothetical protein R6X02_07250 [Enhygromyxa sp.]
MSDRIQRTKDFESKHPSPQRFGVLPTRWFWTDRGNRRLTRVQVAALAGVLLLSFGVFGLPMILGALPALLFFFGLGLIERQVRRKALASPRSGAA